MNNNSSPRLIGEPVFAGYSADLDGFFDEDALSEADAIDASATIEVSRDSLGVYRMAEPIGEEPEAGALRMGLDEALDLVRAMLLEGGVVSLRPELTDADLLLPGAQ